MYALNQLVNRALGNPSPFTARCAYCSRCKRSNRANNLANGNYPLWHGTRRWVIAKGCWRWAALPVTRRNVVLSRKVMFIEDRFLFANLSGMFAVFSD